MARTIDLSTLPKKQYGNKTQIDWDSTISRKIPFVYDSISGDLTVLEHQKGNYIVIGYLDRIKRLRTNCLFRLQFRDLIDPDKEQLHLQSIKSHEVFLKEVREQYNDEYEILSQYQGNKRPILIRHNCAVCNYREFSPTPNNFLRGSTCPSCNGSPSFPEVCLMLVISRFFPESKRQKINNRECDIVFYAYNKRIGIQYDGAFYHKDPLKDNTFNQLFLKDKTSYLIRIRETGCPGLIPHDRLYELKATTDYSKKYLQEILSCIFSVISTLFGKVYNPHLTDEIMTKARQQSKRSYHYKLLMEQYINYLHKHQTTPVGKSADNLQSRMTTAIREHRFSDEELAPLLFVRKQYGLLVKENAPDLVFQNMLDFHLKNGIMPRQQAGDAEETRLCREIKKCVDRDLFTEQQLLKYKQLRKSVPNYPIPSDCLYNMYVEFIRQNRRLPGTGDILAEKSLMSKVNHRLNRNSFSAAQRAEIECLRHKYSRKYTKNRIITEYRGFLATNNRLPFYNAEGTEGKLEKNVLRYLRKHCFTAEECKEMLGMRSKYQPITRRFAEYILYSEGNATSFVQNQYEVFCTANGRLPIKSRHSREEYELCRLIAQYLDPSIYPFGQKVKQPQKTDDCQKQHQPHSCSLDEQIKSGIINRHKTPTETFEEAMNFYKENKRFPLHIHKRGGQERSYEGKLASRITSLYRQNRFSPEQIKLIDQLRFKNKDKAVLLYEHFFSYIEENGGKIPKHKPGTDENRLLNSLKNHMRQGHYTQKQLDELLRKLPDTRCYYPATSEYIQIQ